MKLAVGPRRRGSGRVRFWPPSAGHVALSWQSAPWCQSELCAPGTRQCEENEIPGLSGLHFSFFFFSSSFFYDDSFQNTGTSLSAKTKKILIKWFWNILLSPSDNSFGYGIKCKVEVEKGQVELGLLLLLQFGWVGALSSNLVSLASHFKESKVSDSLGFALVSATSLFGVLGWDPSNQVLHLLSESGLGYKRSPENAVFNLAFIMHWWVVYIVLCLINDF